MQRMVDRVEADVRGEEDVIADVHRSAVEDGAADVAVEVFADVDVPPVIAVKRRADVDAFRQFAEQFSEQRRACRRVMRRGLRVIAPEEVAAAPTHGGKRRVVRLVRRAGKHFFVFSHQYSPSGLAGSYSPSTSLTTA